MKKTKLIFIFLLLSSINLLSKTYYIDSEKGDDNNSGFSPSDALKNFSSLILNKLSPGDSVLFKKGCHWNETISISVKGYNDDPISFSSYGTGHLPTIDLKGKNANGIYIYDSKNLILDGFNVVNIGIDSSNIKVVSSQNCIVRSCSLYVTGRAGIFLEKDKTCTMQNNFITTPAELIPNQSDGIYAQRNSDNIYDGNTIIDQNLSPEQHSDCIQLYQETNAIVRNNYLEQKNEKRSNAQGLYCTLPFGTHIYYNNVITAPNTKAHVMAFLNLKKGTGKVMVLNNTLSGGFMNIFRTDTDDPIIKNNVFITTGKYSMVRLDTALSNAADINNNIYYSQSDKPVNYQNKEYTFKDWVKMGKESEGLETDPHLNKDFTPKPESPIINKGSDLSIIFKEDKTGFQRIKKKRFDIGAYEYKGDKK